MKPTTKRRYRRRRRHTNNTSQFVQPAHSEEYMEDSENSSFLSAGERKSTPLRPFITPAHDPTEQQAEAMAEKVVNGNSTAALQPASQNMVQRHPKDESAIHKMSDEPDEIGWMTEEEQMHPVEDEEIGRVEEEGINRMPSNAKVDQAADDEERVATKSEGRGTPTVSQGFAGGLKSTKSKGSPMGSGTQAEMSSAFGYDFSGVRIHTHQQAEQLSGEIHAQAFTHGKDVYFNRNKYSPETKQGKKLLAHELTHVVQQDKDGAVKRLQRTQVPGISTPIPKGFKKMKDKKGKVVRAVGAIGGVRVIIKRDKRGRTKLGTPGETLSRLKWTLPEYDFTEGKVIKVYGKGKVTMITQTTYQKKVKPDTPSEYGKGTTEADKAAGNTTLRFHEGSHGSFANDYLKTNPLPEFTGKVGMSVKEFKRAIDDFNKAMNTYADNLLKADTQATDCSGTPGSMCTP